MKRALRTTFVLIVILGLSNIVSAQTCGGGGGGGGRGLGGGGTRLGPTGAGGEGDSDKFKPGENDRLEWLAKDANLAKLFHREPGAKRPMLLLIYSKSFDDDCCAANFERTLFRDRDCVEASANFICAKINRDKLDKELEACLARFKLNAKKPAILLLDAESGLLHKQQKCINPPEYLAIMNECIALNEKRVSGRSKFMESFEEAHKALGAGQYGKARQELMRLHDKEQLLIGGIGQLVDADLQALDKRGAELFERATSLEKQNEILEAYKIYVQVREDFSHLADLSGKADERARALYTKLKAAGVDL